VKDDELLSATQNKITNLLSKEIKINKGNKKK